MTRFTLRMTIAIAALVGTAGQRLAADDWPQWLGPQRDGVWREQGILDKFPKSGPQLVWKIPVGGGYAGPAVAKGRVFVMDRSLADDKETAPNKLGDPTKGAGDGKERILCLSAKNGSRIWEFAYECKYSKVAYPSGPRCTPVVEGERVYTLGTMGDIYCLDAGSGKPLWNVNLFERSKAKWPVWGCAAHPLIVADLLITLAGGEGSAVVALDKKSGKEVWRQLTTEEVGYAPPVLVKAGGREQLLIWISEALSSLDPKTGKVYWSIPYPEDGLPQRPSVNIMMPRVVGDLVFVGNFYHGPLVVRLDPEKPAATVAWRGKSKNPTRPDGINPVMNSPVVKDGMIYGICGMGELRCVVAKDGEVKWETLEAVGGKREQFMTAFLIEHEGRWFVFNELGELMIAKMDASGFTKLDSATIIEPTMDARGPRKVVWCHPAFAERCIFVRNDKELVCFSLAAKS
jgi:outer membrane protein assembly factor BamB